MTDAFTIRRATPADAPAVARLADALSINEGDPTGHFNEQAIRRDCFGSKPALMLWVAETGTTLIGYASAHTAYESAWAARGWHLEHVH